VVVPPKLELGSFDNAHRLSSLSDAIISKDGELASRRTEDLGAVDARRFSLHTLNASGVQQG